MGKPVSVADALAGLGAVSKLDTMGQMELLFVAPEEILVNEKNEAYGFDIDRDLTDFAESIRLVGLKQPCTVERCASAGTPYRMIAGHRRRAAYLWLAAQYPDQPQWQKLPCVLGQQQNETYAELALILTNTTARQMGGWRLNELAQKTEALLVKLQEEQGVTLPGRMRDKVAALLKTSASALARAKFVSENLAAGAAALRRSDDVNYKLAHLPLADQTAICAHYKKDPWRLDGSAIALYKKILRKIGSRLPRKWTARVTVMYALQKLESLRSVVIVMRSNGGARMPISPRQRPAVRKDAAQVAIGGTSAMPFVPWQPQSSPRSVAKNPICGGSG